MCSFMVGFYCGNNVIFVFDILVLVFVVGVNEFKINVVSGNVGEGFFSFGYVFDVVDLLK